MKVERKIKLPNGQSVYGRKIDKQIIKLEMPQIIKTPIGDLLLTKEIFFYENGKFQRFSLYIDQEINTKYGKFLLNKENPVSFYNNGKLKSVSLQGEENTIKTKYGKFPIIYSLHFNENGTIKGMFLKHKESINFLNTNIKINSNISFFDNENIAEINLSDTYIAETKYGELRFEKISFHKNGKIEEGRFVDNTINIILIKNNKIFIQGDIVFYDNGNLKRIRLDKSAKIKTLIGELEFEKKGYIYFHKNGNLETGWINEPQIVNILNNKIVIDSIVEFHENGNLKTATITDRQIGYKKNGDEVELSGKICLDKKGNLKEKCE